MNEPTKGAEAMSKWQPISTAPKDRRILVRHASGLTHCGEWWKNPATGHEAFRITSFKNEDGSVDCLIIPSAIEWAEIPA